MDYAALLRGGQMYKRAAQQGTESATHQSITARVATGFELGNLLVENELCQFIVVARRTRLNIRTLLYTRLQTNRKSLVQNEKQLAANLRDELSIFPSRGDWI
jgi:hypothetical protein